jgi:hypothetical protein
MDMLIKSELASDLGGGDDQTGYAEADGNLTDEKFVAAFRRISGPSDLNITLKLATLCAAKQFFSAAKLTLQRLKLNESKFSKYVQIGRDRRFDEIRERLPEKAGYSVLYAMSQLNEEQWQRAITGGVINSRSSRSEIEAFRTGIPKKKPARNEAGPFFAGVKILKGTGDKDKEKFRADFISLCERAGFEAVFPENRN